MPMAAVDGTGHTVRYVNRAFCLLLGKPEEELLGKAFSSVVPVGDEFLSLLGRVYRGEGPETHTGPEHMASDSFYWSCAMWPVVAADGRPVGIMIQVTETTPFHRQSTAMNQALMLGSVHQHELTELSEALNEQLQTEILERQHAEDELRQANDDLSQFSYAASHDLQEPLRMITNYSQLLIRGYRGRLDDDASLYVDFITKGTRQMRDLLTDLLAFAAAGARGLEPAERVDLNLIVQTALYRLTSAIEESGATVTTDVLPTVLGHDTVFVQLFQNLIGNAIKYRAECAPRIYISAQKMDTDWRFAVTDNGIGIAPEYHQKIFGVFKRLHGKSIPGTGIGLAICQRVVERYAGRIWVESEAGRGATFYFTLPAASEEKP